MTKAMKVFWISFIAISLFAWCTNSWANIIPLKKPIQYNHHINWSYIQFHIKQNEGFSLQVYRDTRGFKTVGYGHKLSKKSKYKVGDFVDRLQIDIWFRSDLNSALVCAKKYLKNDFNHEELTVITDMAFNLGCSGLNQFWRLRKHINNKDYNMAVKAIRGSTYYKQVKNRADRNIQLLNNI